ncbi:WbqC family protein [Chryseobacterium sp. MFBS3-17]|uniref:WbqC family protein n=1 Tax=Chryseobacterium sp. MFBS3-17 TaxID=2886689 RepID=UPI001D0F23B8|nr:WbqC family protein [Chryseobacterium sp. MFBS3-17]MCC2590753.1 WbqC family protein [Chryseobacterium sp. MFBS3-17]
MKVLLPVFYLPPVSWMSVFLNEENEVTLEQHEHFPKQTYRNRAHIYGANGRLPLFIPIRHNGQRAMKDIEVSTAENWKGLHWKSIKTAYQSSPYFEFYEDRLKEIFTFESDSLLDLNLHSIDVFQKILKTEKAYVLNAGYAKVPDGKDYRDMFSAKKDSPFQLEEYYQTFSDKLGFQKDLSILDLICNKGPETLTYLKEIQKNNN